MPTRDVLTNLDNRAGGAGVGGLETSIEDAHGGAGPNHGDEAFQNHHVVEGHAAFLLALNRAGDDGGLGRMEAGQDATGHGHKEHRQEVAIGKVLTIAEGRLLTGGCINSPRVERDAMPVIPQVQQGIALDEQAGEHAYGGEQQDCTEDGVDLADDGVDGEHGGDQIVDKDRPIDDPGGDGGGSAVKAEDSGGGDVAGGVDEHSTHQQQQQAHKHVVDPVNTLVGILVDHGGHLGTAVTQADHTREVVVHGAADDITDGDGNKGDGTKEDALDGAKDRAGTCNVQQIDQHILPLGHGHIVHTVLLGIGRSLPVIGTKHLFADRAVDSGTHEQDDKADDECNHTHTLLNIRSLFSQYRPEPARVTRRRSQNVNSIAQNL